jgi:hypothetical protein
VSWVCPARDVERLCCFFFAPIMYDCSVHRPIFLGLYFLNRSVM